MKLSEHQQQFAWDVSCLIEQMIADGYACTFGEAYRTPEQAALNEIRGIGVKDSQHCKRLAVDLNLFKDGAYLADTESHRPFGEYWESLDPRNRWGGRYKDGNHYERMEKNWR